MEWRLSPAFDYGKRPAECGWRNGTPVASWGSDALAVANWDAGRPEWQGASVGARFDIAAGDRAVLALAHAHREPLVLPGRLAVERRLTHTIGFCQGWTADCTYEGRWRTEVHRSALLLKLLILAPSGASVAAPTT